MAVGMLLALPAVAAAVDVNAIAKTYVIAGDAVVGGDLVSFDRATQVFRRTAIEADPAVYGVVVSDPVVELRTSTEGVPMVTTGEARVNVSTANGAIAAGEYLTASAVPGRAERSSRADDVVIGVALEAFPVGAAALSEGDATVYTGTIRALIGVGMRPDRGSGEGRGPGAGVGAGGSATGLNTPIANLIKYLLAALVVIGSMYLAFHNFGSTLKDSIVSVGRNPLAKSAIQSMVVINVTLVIVITAVGLFIGLMILFVQL